MARALGQGCQAQQCSSLDDGALQSCPGGCFWKQNLQADRRNSSARSYPVCGPPLEKPPLKCASPSFCLPEEDPRHSDRPPGEITGSEWGRGQPPGGQGRSLSWLRVSVCECVLQGKEAGQQDGSLRTSPKPVWGCFPCPSFSGHKGAVEPRAWQAARPMGGGLSSPNLACLRPALLFKLTSECGNQEEEGHRPHRAPCFHWPSLNHMQDALPSSPSTTEAEAQES